MRFAAALSTEAATRRAIDEVCQQALDALGSRPDLAFLFVSHQHGPDFQPLVAGVSAATGAGALIGCTGESIVGAGREIEEAPALALWLAMLPEVRIAPMHLEFEHTAEGMSFSGWPEDLPPQWSKQSALLLLGDPYSFPADALLERLNEDQPGVQVLGGMSSGGHSPGQNQLFLGGEELSSGAVGVWLDGPLAIRSVVSQGCRPIGKPLIVTKAERNVIQELGGQPALKQVQELFAALTQREQELARGGLHVGRVINEYQDSFRRGDFLIRNVMGADQQSGSVAVGDFMRGQTVQFHVRDAESADEDLRELAAVAAQESAVAGALVFTCNGRGSRLFPEPNHNAQVISQVFGPVPQAGFFAQGEIGPIGGRNFLHGFTASVALFGPRPA